MLLITYNIIFHISQYSQYRYILIILYISHICFMHENWKYECVIETIECCIILYWRRYTLSLCKSYIRYAFLQVFPFGIDYSSLFWVCSTQTVPISYGPCGYLYIPYNVHGQWTFRTWNGQMDIHRNHKISCAVWDTFWSVN